MENLKIVNRAVQGVRRWIGSQPPSNHSKVHGKSTSKPEAQKASTEHTLDWYSTEAMAEQLLNPVVSEVEEAEYQGSVFLPRQIFMNIQVAWIVILTNVKNFWMHRRL